MVLLVAAVILLVVGSCWSAIDAARRPGRWRRLFDARRARTAMIWIALVSVAAAIGAALAGGGETAAAIIAFGLVAELIASRIFFLARLNRWLE